ncbi:MAG: amidohydrolase family protein [Chloroflexi bacterium]|nr:amidohydrolase family protein [Chloroflexota bacterium]
MKIDIYSHIMTPKYLDLINRYGGAIQLMAGVTSLWSLEDRFRVMDKFPDVIQVLVPGATSRNITAAQEKELARTTNEEVAGLLVKYPDRFIASAAALPYKDPDAMMREAERALKDLKLKGVLMSTPLEGKPIDRPEFMPLYALMEQHDLPVWLHPARPPTPEYKGEEKSAYDMWLLWGWPYESTLAMTRLVFSKVLQKHPKLKMIIHHAGAMVPFFRGRIANFYGSWETTGKENHKAGLENEPLEYFRQFHVDTAVGGSAEALICAHSFYGAGGMLFGTDFPYDAENGYLSTRHGIDAIEGMDIPEKERQQIFETNARKLLNL